MQRGALTPNANDLLTPLRQPGEEGLLLKRLARKQPRASQRHDVFGGLDDLGIRHPWRLFAMARHPNNLLPQAHPLEALGRIEGAAVKAHFDRPRWTSSVFAPSTWHRKTAIVLPS